VPLNAQLDGIRVLDLTRVITETTRSASTADDMDDLLARVGAAPSVPRKEREQYG
jgi:hypothetical protein